jgi:predicted nuclease of predicted toxin-antitoxin system
MLLLDEQYTGLRPFLESLGWEITTVNQVDLAGKPDTDIMNYAKENDLILITQDVRLAQLAELNNLRHVLVSFPKIARLVDQELRKLSLSE